MLIKAEDSALLVIDAQTRLLPHIHDAQRVIENIVWLIEVAKKIGVPVMATEQYPKGIGPTHDDIAACLPQGSVAEKVHFSCVAAGCLEGLPGADRPQIVVCGTESHVCVLQTVLDLRARGKEVFVVADAVGSRDPEDRALALERMKQNGAEVVSREMVAFEWLHRAGTPLFKEISRDFLK